MQLNLTGFLERNTPKFMNSLWKLLLSAQDTPDGIPPRLVEDMKVEIREQRAMEVKKETNPDEPKLSAIEKLKRQDEEGAFRGRGRGGFRGGRGRGRGRGGYSRRDDRDYRMDDRGRDDRRDRDDRDDQRDRDRG